MNQVNQDASDITLRDLLFVLSKHWKLAVGLAIISGLCGLFVSKVLIPPQYQSEAKLVVNAGGNPQSSVITYDQLNTAQQLVNTCAVILKSDTVLDQVGQNLSLSQTSKDLVKQIDISPVDSTEVLDIKVKDTDPKVAADIANEIAKLAPNILVKTVKASSVETFSAAKENTTPVSPNVPLVSLVSFLAGLAAAFLIAVLIEKLDDSFSTEEDVQKYLQLTVLGVIPNVDLK